ncbi:Heme oxygenase 1 [Portunus trituberculatus]|uniref:Heme oxygenase 1 n=1 Tax=Portunus trituberculatus TaxID=210409 RepID=A0A5B7I251_PORTR|nr:Heme oxygenase 1 [Portunus trituberculatus]
MYIFINFFPGLISSFSIVLGCLQIENFDFGIWEPFSRVDALSNLGLMDNKEDVLFTKKMRIVTREIHGVSDALINAKIGFAMSADRVWAEGLLVFYEVFLYLEGALDRYSHTLIGEVDVPGMRRKEAFEKDLAYYLGANWKEGYTPRESVQQYLKHLEKLEEENPYLLLAYVYHLYMGLLSGGQILRRKRALLQKLKFSRKIAIYNKTYY